MKDVYSLTLPSSNNLIGNEGKDLCFNVEHQTVAKECESQLPGRSHLLAPIQISFRFRYKREDCFFNPFSHRDGQPEQFGLRGRGEVWRKTGL